jgi:hypothetical protein
MQNAGASIPNVQGGSGSSPFRDSANNQQRRGTYRKNGLLIRAVHERRVPFGRRGWKESTAGTSEQIVKSHLVPELGKALLHLNGIFKLALSDGLALSNPAAELS